MKSKDRETTEGPLTTAALHILLALAESDLHGYGIMQTVKLQSEGSYRIGPGTLYANLSSLMGKGWVGETQRKLEDGSSRREYFLTSAGEKVLRAEVHRLRQLVTSARRRLTKLDERNA